MPGCLARGPAAGLLKNGQEVWKRSQAALVCAERRQGRAACWELGVKARMGDLHQEPRDLGPGEAPGWSCLDFGFQTPPPPAGKHPPPQFLPPPPSPPPPIQGAGPEVKASGWDWGGREVSSSPLESPRFPRPPAWGAFLPHGGTPGFRLRLLPPAGRWRRWAGRARAGLG